MSDFEKKKLDMELSLFTRKNFEKPTDCKNLDQIRFYVKELCAKIEEFEKRFNYVPTYAYTLLSQYNSMQNKLLNSEFRSTYC
ncbi:MAG: hypothetical protein ACK57K_00765 [Chryseotalea sp.]|jgi:hypothetical protein|nr:hypothetical protein [Cytophagales bacterium]